MKETENYFSRIAFKQPFASKDGAAKATISNTSADNAVNFPDGFPSIYAAGNGKYVTRAEMNAIGNLASQNQFFFLAGGINTFDEDFCGSIGGYPKGAVLKYINNGYLYDVISLVDDNFTNFVTTGVDGINWKYLSVTEKKVFDDLFFEGGSGMSVGSALLGVVKAKKSGGIVLSTSLSPVVGQSKSDFSYSGSEGFNIYFGCGVMIKDLGDSVPNTIPFPEIAVNDSTVSMNWNGWKSLSGDYALGIGNAQTTMFSYIEQSMAGFFTSLVAGRNYAIALMCGIGDWSNDEINHEIECSMYQSIEGTLKIMYA